MIPPSKLPIPSAETCYFLLGGLAIFDACAAMAAPSPEAQGILLSASVCAALAALAYWTIDVLGPRR